MQDIILVNEEGIEIGTGQKMDVHERGLLHRAFSVFVFNSRKELMLQQRALHKYHTPGLWTNTCCSHPKPKETTKDAALRRLKEEMGLTCEVEEVFQFSYYKKFDNGLIENEYDHVFLAFCEDTPKLNPEEAHAWKWVPWNVALHEIENHPKEYTYWYRTAYPQLIKYMKGKGIL